MKKTTYFNRYGDHIVFEEIDQNTIIMSGFVHYRVGEDEHNSCSFIDPSGGPFIQVGSDVGRYFDDNKERKVKSIQFINKNWTLAI